MINSKVGNKFEKFIYALDIPSGRGRWRCERLVERARQVVNVYVTVIRSAHQSPTCHPCQSPWHINVNIH